MARLQPKATVENDTTNEEQVTTEEQVTVETPASKKSKTVKVIFDEVDGTESNDLLIGLNGKLFQIKRGVEVTIPRDLLNVVNESVYTKLRYDKDGNSYYKEVPRITYRIVGE